jgi:hypothetical protein
MEMIDSQCDMGLGNGIRRLRLLDLQELRLPADKFPVVNDNA